MDSEGSETACPSRCSLSVPGTIAMVSVILGEMWRLRSCSLTVRLKGKLIDGLSDWLLIVPRWRPIPSVGWLALVWPKTNLSSTQGTQRRPGSTAHTSLRHRGGETHGQRQGDREGNKGIE